MKAKLLGLAIAMALVGPAKASSVTYAVNIQAGFSITGTITTDGNIGALYDGDVIAYDLVVSTEPEVVCLGACTVNPVDPLSQYNISGGQYATGPGLVATSTGELTFNFAAKNSNFIILGSNTYPSDYVEFYDWQVLPHDEGIGGIQVGGGDGYPSVETDFYPSVGNVPCDSNGNCVIGATPIPPALPLFATGLGAISLLGRRRKQSIRHRVGPIAASKYAGAIA
jgi:hypothetical protein